MEIPLSDGNILRNLQRVDMSSNSFTGHIQASIFSVIRASNNPLLSVSAEDHDDGTKAPFAGLKLG